MACKNPNFSSCRGSICMDRNLERVLGRHKLNGMATYPGLGSSTNSRVFSRLNSVEAMK